MQETKFIASSLASLHECVRKLASQASVIPFRNSKLTMVPQGGVDPGVTGGVLSSPTPIGIPMTSGTSP